MAIRKATACRFENLLDAFVSNGLIETIHERLCHIGPEKMKKIENTPDTDRTPYEDKEREIQINCQCIMIQLCYRAQNIKKLEALNAIEFIKSFENMKFNRKSLEECYVQTILQYCSENTSIRLQGPPRFFCRKIFTVIDDLINEDKVRQHRSKYELCFHSLANLSLVRAVHEIMWRPDNIRVLIDQVEELILIIKEDDHEVAFEKIAMNHKRYLSSMRALSNCLTSNNTILTFEEEDFSQLAKELIEIFEIFNDWKKMDIMSVNLAMLIESNDEIQHFFATL